MQPAYYFFLEVGGITIVRSSTSYSMVLCSYIYYCIHFKDTLLLAPYSLPTKESRNNGEAFLPDSPRNIIQTGKFCDVPLNGGISPHEGMIMIPRE